MKMTIADLKTASKTVYEYMQPTPQYAWPLLAGAVGTEVWLKHENHTPTGAFKARGGFTFMKWLKETHPNVTGIITATRGNHGQSQALAAAKHGLRAIVYVPEGNSVEKNAAMKAFGAELHVHGADFDTSREKCEAHAAQDESLFLVPSFHEALVQGVATYGFELLNAVPDLDRIYVPIGCGSGACGTIMARDALGLKTEIIGVVSEHAQTAKLSFDAGKMVETETARTFADGMAVRVPVPSAFEIYQKGLADIITISEQEVADAIRLIYKATHNLAEGAGAAPMAGVMQQRTSLKGKKVAAILCGQNIDAGWFETVIKGGIPDV